MSSITPHHPDLVVGPDGVARCAWPGLAHADYRDYHDREWGKPVHGETALFMAARLGKKVALKKLLELGASPYARAGRVSISADGERQHEVQHALEANQHAISTLSPNETHPYASLLCHAASAGVIVAS